MRFCDRNCVILWTKRAKCTLNKKILDLLNERKILDSLNEESVSGVVELVYNLDEKSTVSVRKGKATAKEPFKLFGGLHTYIYMYI